jgi:hypothetical protein
VMGKFVCCNLRAAEIVGKRIAKSTKISKDPIETTVTRLLFFSLVDMRKRACFVEETHETMDADSGESLKILALVISP